ncbi:HNH endonuclease, partial [Enterococcus cecorum]|nr:HNH endonuclease [Enterococcus cecorum]
RYYGNEYCIKGRRTSSDFTLMDIYGQTISFNHMSKGQKTPKAKNCHGKSARKSWIVTTKKIENIA